ncbi:MAG TPA: pyruvate kinase [bacterium]|nr:pyruvate kinase [bacterium]
MDRLKKTKIIATIGPASWPEDVLKGMIDEGMNAARVNGAFADIEELKRVAKLVRNISSDVALILDIKGHEVRLNKFEDDIPIKTGDKVVIGSSEEDKIFPITYPELYKDLRKKSKLLLDDGNVELAVEDIRDGKIHTRVIHGELLKKGKSINIPGTPLSNDPITERDIKQIKFVIEDNWSFIAASFIRSKEDILAIREHIKDSHLKIIAKIEDQQGVDNFDEILRVSDGIMVARGDLGIEIPFEKIPETQKELIAKSNIAAKPVITATQMLESMVEKPRPTRAEISDVGNAIYDRTDAIMLSGETSTGKYPLEAVRTMKMIAVEAEDEIDPRILPHIPLNLVEIDKLASAAYQICEDKEIKAVILISETDEAARVLSRINLVQPIFAYVKEEYTKMSLLLSKGVYPLVLTKTYKDRDKALDGIVAEAVENKQIKKGEKVLVIGVLDEKESKFFPSLFETVTV